MSGRPLSLALYGAATALLEPLAPALLRRRARRGKEDAARLPERLGRAALARPPGRLAWLHGVSVGESLSLLPVIEALRARRPDLALLVTSGTVTSAEMMARRLPAGVLHQFAPIDAPGAVRRFLDHWRPDLALFVESELWPNLLLAARARGVKLALFSARMTEASAQGWARAPAAARAVLGAFDLVLPQDGATAERLARLGARVGPALNLKLVGAAPPVDERLVAELRQAAAGRRVVLAASTHPGEEPLIARAFRDAVAEGPPALLMLAPRHPERGAEVVDALRRAGLLAARRSAGEPCARETHVYVADTLGELGAFYSVADAVVMGGAFAQGIGGHNPMEAARLGRPILTGPHAANAREIYDALFAEAAAIEARDAAELSRHIGGLLTYPAIARRIGEAALDFAERQGSALHQALTALQPLMPA